MKYKYENRFVIKRRQNLKRKQSYNFLITLGLNMHAYYYRFVKRI